ncbi:MetQ/NlpA family ABC transporter substrate-binding protein [uncultured Anaerococcus sp.]|uniref:MetQ/NlpA family ABC transporter substrate-binding protein n=1 Tax=uncultured Anaerococcus sp. TaxID=293428 RepID=UPI00280BD4DB|nr:MetQ/NlpA family ABC transporter substrate-binding protein [uncultured Anaerococcus sp.]MDU5149107.1 MetQ/NlpA family ABC transporter substrate-binding protein [Anaerococcus prevotii]
MKKFAKIALALAVLVGFSACGAKDNESSKDASAETKAEDKAEGTTIKIGVVGEYNEVLEKVIARYEEATGNKVELQKFSDYSQPNEALIAGDIDLNAYQHHKFLDEFNESKGSDLISIGDTMLAPMGLYSEKIKSIDELEDGAKVAIPNDPTNGSRALFLLQEAGLIKVDGQAGDLIGVDKVTDNPKNLEIIEMDASTTPRSLEDVDIAAVNDTFALDSGLDKEKSVFVEDPKSESVKEYINLIAARKEDENNEAYKEFVKYYQTEETKKDMEEITKGAWLPAWE